MIFHMSHIWNICENFNVADTIRRRVKPIYKDWNICDLCENFYVADIIRRQVKPIHKDWNICDLCEIFYVADAIRRWVKPIHKDHLQIVHKASWFFPNKMWILW